MNIWIYERESDRTLEKVHNEELRLVVIRVKRWRKHVARMGSDRSRHAINDWRVISKLILKE